jgi:hypothetical protein
MNDIFYNNITIYFTLGINFSLLNYYLNFVTIITFPSSVFCIFSFLSFTRAHFVLCNCLLDSSVGIQINIRITK